MHFGAVMCFVLNFSYLDLLEMVVLGNIPGPQPRMLSIVRVYLYVLRKIVIL